MGFVNLHPVEIEGRKYEQGEFTSPRDHDNPDKGDITLRFTRVPSSIEGTPVVFLTGGPGDSAQEWLRHIPLRAALGHVSALHPLLLLEQRGCGLSEPKLPLIPISRPRDLLADPASAFAALTEQAQASLATYGADFEPSEITPLQSARDLKVLASLLGAERLHLWGYSYGTHLTMAALKTVPEVVDRVVLSGFEGPDQTFKLPSRIQAQLVRLHELFRRNGACEDFLGLMRAAHARLDSNTMVVPLKSGAMSLAAWGLRWMMGSWVGLSNRYKHAPALYRAVLDGETDKIARFVEGFLGMLDRRPATFYLKDSASGATNAKLNQIRLEEPSCDLRDGATFPFPAIREAYRQIDLGDDFRAPLKTDKPLFILTGSIDGFTPTENAVESLKGLPNARHAVIEGAAHNDLMLCLAAVQDACEFLTGQSPLARAYRL